AESNQAQIFVQPYPSTGVKYRVPTDGGAYPLWSSDGKLIFYGFSGSMSMFVIDFRTEPTVSFGKPSPLPLTGILQPFVGMRNFDISPDGKRFVVVMPDSAPAPTGSGQRPTAQINVVLNWFDELKQRVPAPR